MPSQFVAGAAAGLAAAREHARLSSAARDLVARSRSVVEAVERLTEAGFLTDAVELLAHALAGPDAVVWVCRCAEATAPADLPEADRSAAAAAGEWSLIQRDESRRAAMKHAERAGLRTPEAWAAAAAFFSGESLSEPDLPVVSPAANLAGQAVAGAVMLAAVRNDPARRELRLGEFLRIGAGIAAAGAQQMEDVG